MQETHPWKSAGGLGEAQFPLPSRSDDVCLAAGFSHESHSALPLIKKDPTSLLSMPDTQHPDCGEWKRVLFPPSTAELMERRQEAPSRLGRHKADSGSGSERLRSACFVSCLLPSKLCPGLMRKGFKGESIQLACLNPGFSSFFFF